MEAMGITKVSVLQIFHIFAQFCLFWNDFHTPNPTPKIQWKPFCHIPRNHFSTGIEPWQWSAKDLRLGRLNRNSC
jgi:hypothetical protein